MAQYENFRNIKDDRLGDLTLLRHKETGELLAQKAIQINSQEDDEALMSRFNERFKLNHPHVVNVQKVEKIQEDYLCSSMRKVHVYLDFYRDTLAQDIAAR